MNWTDLHTRLASEGLLIDPFAPVPNVTVSGVSQDSRDVNPGYVFTAVQGTNDDGHTYIQNAITRGASVIVCQENPDQDPRFIQVSNTRKASAVIAAVFYGNPSSSLHLTGVTGTNGKTTTAALVKHVLEYTGTRTGLIGTISYMTGKTTYPAQLTTPDATHLQPIMAEMVCAGCQACVIEVSSHALDQYRTATLNFSVGVFTNLMHDHLDYHLTREHYFKSKKRLFDELRPDAVAVYNQDDQVGQCIVKNTLATPCSFGQNTDADIRFRIVKDSPNGLQLLLDGKTSTFRLAGTFNAYNLAAAYGAARASGLPRSDVIEALSEARPVAGRFEQYVCDDATRIVVDFAHTPGALEQVLRSLAHIRSKTARLWCVFGCGGNRDVKKRPLMGAIAEKLADYVVITNDNPRREPAESVAQDILRGMKKPERSHVILSRTEAVHFVARACRAEDIVLIAGRGHESVQEENGLQVKLKDHDLVFEAFASRNPTPLF